MDVTEIKKLMEVLNSTDVKEITLESDGTKVQLKKDKNIARKTQQVFVEPTVEAVEPKEEKNIKPLISLNVGKFYLKEKNGKEIVKVGDTIKEQQVVGYIEAIGIRTDIKSDKSGVVREILISNDSRVEFGQEIMLIEAV